MFRAARLRESESLRGETYSAAFGKQRPFFGGLLRTMDHRDVVRGFEGRLAMLTGARYCVCVNSCTMAAKLAFDWYSKQMGSTVLAFPRQTYRSMPAMAEKAGLMPVLTDEKWEGQYRITPSNIWDCALTLRPRMYVPGSVMLLSFHPQKPLALSSGGGAILHDDPEADRFYRQDSFDARSEGVGIRSDDWSFDGEHCYMFAGQAGEGIHRLDIFEAAHPEGLTMPQPDYEDLKEKMERRKNATGA